MPFSTVNDGPTASPAAPAAELLVPQPHRTRSRPGEFRVPELVTIRTPPALEPPERAALERLARLFRDRFQSRVQFSPGDPGSDGPLTLSLSAPTNASEQPLDIRGTLAERDQGYVLRIRPERAEAVSTTSAGLFYSVQTLAQLTEIHGRAWPCLEIEDAPDFPVRGFSYDVSRGKVPTLATLKELADRLAALKVNHLQLYVEHTFAFAFNPNIGKDCSPLTADEIREFDAYCRARHIDLVPSLASCGHMGFVLSLPEYRHLAEVEPAQGWWAMPWMKRMRGLTIDVTNPESRTLLENMYGEFLPLFSSALANVCCDETYDLGQGKNRQHAAESGKGKLYLDHLRFLHDLCRRHGKRMMFWGDIIKSYPELLTQLPSDTVVLHWDYAPAGDFQSTKTFTDAGLTTYVCPGTSAWNRVLNDINAADLNIRGFAATGQACGATGLLNTDWGDEGHVNLMAGSWHPVVLGAALAWNTKAPAPDEFDRAFSRLFLGHADPAPTQMLRRLLTVSNLSRSWPAFCTPLTETVPPEALSDETLARWHAWSAEAAECFARHPRAGDSQDVRELTVACRQSHLLAERFQIARRLAALGGAPDAALREQLMRFAAACEALMPAYEQAWLARNKSSCLHEIVAVFHRLAHEARDIARKGA